MAYGLCLQGEWNLQFIKDCLLDRSWPCEHIGGQSIAEAHGTAGQGCKVLQQGAEAVNGAPIGGLREAALALAAAETLAGATGERRPFLAFSGS